MSKDEGSQTGDPALCVWLSFPPQPWQHPASQLPPTWLEFLSSAVNSFQKLQRTVKAGKEFLSYRASLPVSAMFTTGQRSHPPDETQVAIPNPRCCYRKHPPAFPSVIKWSFFCIVSHAEKRCGAEWSDALLPVRGWNKVSLGWESGLSILSATQQ